LKIALSFPACQRRGGVERVMLECANFLASRGHATHILATIWDADSLHSDVQAHFVPARTTPPLLRLWSFKRQSARTLAAMTEIERVGSFGIMSPPGVLWVQSVHGAWLEISAARRGWKARLKQKLNPVHPYTIHLEKKVFGGRTYRHLIALTPQVKADLIRLYRVPETDISIIPNGFSPEEFNVEMRGQWREKRRQQLGYKPEHQVVIFVANELERKGFGPLLRAIASLNRPNVHLLAVGRLSPSAYVAEIARLGLQQRVQFTGPSSEVASYYAASDVFALPTQYEAWGLVIVEAMACGLPVVTSALAGAAVAVEPGVTGVLLQNPDDVQEIAASLTHFLDREVNDATAIAASVQHLAWSQVLLDYERVLLTHGSQ
jgi:UDP-glucose:(heptosyl)LPS alpha-1,3-glucosyltransferase